MGPVTISSNTVSANALTSGARHGQQLDRGRADDRSNLMLGGDADVVHRRSDEPDHGERGHFRRRRQRVGDFGRKDRAERRADTYAGGTYIAGGTVTAMSNARWDVGS